MSQKRRKVAADTKLNRAQRTRVCEATLKLEELEAWQALKINDSIEKETTKTTKSSTARYKALLGNDNTFSNLIIYIVDDDYKYATD